MDETIAAGVRSHFTQVSSLLMRQLARERGMDRFLWTVLVLLQLLALSESLRDEWKPSEYSDTLTDAKKFLDDYNSTAEKVLFFSQSASWNYNTNITGYNSVLQVREFMK